MFFLKKLLEQLKNRLTQEANNTIVKVRKWMSKYSYTAPDGLVRSDSYMEHLAGPFFPPDNFTRRFRKRSSIFSSQPRNSETQWLENLEEVKRGWDFHEGTSYQSTVMLENIESWNSYRMSSTGGSSSGRRKSSAVYSDQGGGQEGGESARFPKQGSVNNRIMSTHRVVIREEFGNSGGVGSRRASTSANIGQRRQSVISETDDSYRRVSSSAGGGRRMSSIGSSTGDFGGGGSGLRKSLLGRKSSLLEEGGEELEDYYSTAPPSAAIVTTTRTNQRRMSIDSSDGSVRRAPVSFQNRGGATTAASTSAATAAGGLTTILDHEGSSHVSLHNSLFDISEKLIKAGSSKVRKVKVQSNSLLSKTIARVRPFTAGALHAAAPKNRPISAFADEMIRGVGTRGAGGSGRVGGAASTRAKSARVPATNGSSSTPVSIRPFTTLT